MRTPLYALTGFLMLLATSAYANAPGQVGVVGAANPDVFAVSADKQKRMLKVGDAIFLNDQVHTSDKGTAQLMFLDKSSLTINPSSAVTIDTFVYDAAKSTGTMTLDGAKGAMRFIGGALSKKQPVKIKTPVATIGIRGGIAEVHIDAGTGATDSLFLYGEQMTVANLEGKTGSVTELGQGFTVPTGSSAPQTLAPQQVFEHLNHFHTEAVMNSGQDTSVPEVKPAEPSAPVTPENQEPATPAGEEAPLSLIEEKTEVQQPAEKQDDGALPPTTTEPAPTPALPPVNEPTGPAPAPGTAPQSNNLPTLKTFDGAAIPPPPPAPGTFTGTAGYMMPPPPVPNSITNTTSTTSQQQTNNTQAPPVSHRGLYVVTTPGNRREGGAAMFVNTTAMDLQGGLSVNLPTAEGPRPTSLDLPGSPGYHANINGNWGDALYNGSAYLSRHNSMAYYHLNGVSNGSQFAMVAGLQIPYGAALADNIARTRTDALTQYGLTFYSFLPDLGRYYTSGTVSPGFFGHNLISASLAPAGMGSINPVGLMADWTNNVYMVSDIQWAGSASGITGSFGRMNPGAASGSNIFNGTLFKFKPQADAFSFAGVDGTTNVRNDIYGTAGGIVDGFLFEGMTETGERVRQGAMIDAVSLPYYQTETLPDRNSGALHGFMGGYLVDYTSAGVDSQPDAYWNTNASDVSIVKNSSTSSIGAEVKLTGVSVSAPTIEARFGAASGTQSAFVRDELYGASQGTMTYKANSTATTETLSVNSGVLATNDAINPTICMSCDFVHWGVWAADTQSTGSGTHSAANMIPYVAGQITPVANIPTTIGNVVYSGGMHGTRSTNGVLLNQTGGFTANINLMNRTLNAFEGNIDSRNFGFTGQNYNIGSAGLATFQNIPVSGTAGTGHINGALFGPSAENIGGNFYVGNTAAGVTTKYMGVYAGDRP